MTNFDDFLDIDEIQSDELLEEKTESSIKFLAISWLIFGSLSVIASSMMIRIFIEKNNSMRYDSEMAIILIFTLFILFFGLILIINGIRLFYFLNKSNDTKQLLKIPSLVNISKIGTGIMGIGLLIVFIYIS